MTGPEQQSRIVSTRLPWIIGFPLLAAAATWLLVGSVSAGEATKAAPAAEAGGTTKASDDDTKAKDVLKIRILLLREIRENRLPPLSLLDIPPPDNGVAGGKLAILDNNTTGKFLNQEFILETAKSADPKVLVDQAKKFVDDGVAFIVTDVEPSTLLSLSDAMQGKDVLFLNAGAPDDNLRQEDCRANVMHTAPSRRMLTDALTQYLAWKKWPNWFLIIGPTERDKAFADAIRSSAKRYKQKIVEERTFEYDPGSRRSDGGFEQIQQQIPRFTQKAPEHDVVVVADEGELFGDYFPYRTWDARPVVGTAGLYPTSWHPAVELWGGTQFQNRFKRLAKRNMRALDYNVWMAVRSVGEAASRKQTDSAKDLIDYIHSPDFELAAFKGLKLTYRNWNGQLRQPVLLTTAKIHVTVSPQPGFLHQRTELDTLGYDKPESKCKAYTN